MTDTVASYEKLHPKSTEKCQRQLAYTVLQKYAHIGLNQNLFRSTTLDIITRLLDNTAFQFVFVWWEDFQKISWKCVGEGF